MDQWRFLKKHESATAIQRQIRKFIAWKVKERRLLENASANRIQTAWRWRYRDELYRRRQRAARKIQSFERMRVVRCNFIHFDYEHLWLFRASRLLACAAQRLWRGHCGRSIARRRREMSDLPNPMDAKNFNLWLDLQKLSNPPARTWGVYSEYYLSGYP
jgi:hypothetical protein